MSFDPWKVITGASSSASLIGSNDLTFAKINAAKKALKLLNDHSDVLVKLCLAASEGENSVVKNLVSSSSTNGEESIINKVDQQGFTPLIYAICFNKSDCVEILINFNADCNLKDGLIGWTPIMWATYLNFKEIVTQLLNAQADPYLKSNSTRQNAIDLLIPGSEMYEYYKSHNLIKDKINENDDPNQSGNNSLFYKDSNLDNSNNLQEDSFNAQLKLQVAGVSAMGISDSMNSGMTSNNSNNNNGGGGENLYNSSKFINDDDDGNEDDYNGYFYNNEENFDFNEILSKQYIKFDDESISPLMDFIFKLYSKYHNKPIYVSSIVYQCVRYAHKFLQSEEMVETFIDLFITRIRSVINCKSGLVQYDKEIKSDIVMISYWISSINYLYYYLLRDGEKFFQKYPELLKDICDILQLLIYQLIFSIDNRIELIIEDSLLDYDSVPDLNLNYENDKWKIFSKKNKNSKILKKSNYDDILEMLYPPSIEKQMKPSPLKIIQILGGLLYVLELYHINELIKQEIFSNVFYFINCSIFNRLLGNKKYTNRAKAIQIRLNLSMIEDWLRSNNFKPYHSIDNYNQDYENYPNNLTSKDGITANNENQIKINNVLKLTNDDKFKDDPNYLNFYFNSLFKIGKYHLLPSIEFLQWLQVMTSINDIQSLNDTISNFITLTPEHLLKSIKNYKYEIKEEKIKKEIKIELKNMVSRDTDNNKIYKLYFIDNKEKMFLNIGQKFSIILPNLIELLNQYGADIKSKYNPKKGRIHQPFLPLEIIDMIDEIYDQLNDNYSRPEIKDRYFEDEEGNYDDDENDREVDDEESNRERVRDDDGEVHKSITNNANNSTSEFAGSEVFKKLQMPSSVVHKTWQSEEGSNPWA